MNNNNEDIKEYQEIIANWKDINDYEYLHYVVDGNQWAWEFLRRNSDFRQEYSELQELKKDSKFGDDEYAFQLKYKIYGSLQDPSSEKAPIFLNGYPEIFHTVKTLGPLIIKSTKRYGTIIEVPISRGDIVAVLSPDVDIDEQLIKVKKELTKIWDEQKASRGKKIPRLPNTTTLLNCLRLLDAEAMNVSVKESAPIIYEHELQEAFDNPNDGRDIDTIIVEMYKNRKTAKGFVNSGYKRLIQEKLKRNDKKWPPNTQNTTHDERSK